MTESLAYIEVAERSLDAADAALDRAVQEKAAFLGYHAFESVGGAFCRSRGVPFPRSHKKKIATFVGAVRRERFGLSVAALSSDFRSLRDALLYPIPRQDGSIQRPLEVITAAQTKKLLGRTRSLVNRIKPLV